MKLELELPEIIYQLAQFEVNPDRNYAIAESCLPKKTELGALIELGVIRMIEVPIPGSLLKATYKNYYLTGIGIILFKTLRAKTVKQDWCTPTGSTLFECMVEKHLTLADLTEQTKVPEKTLLEILIGKEFITQEIATAFEQVIGIDAQFWIKRDERYRAGINTGLEIIKGDLAPPVWANKDGFITCPYCKGKHRHGGQGNGVASGHRVADCGNKIGYIVIPVDQNHKTYCLP